MRHLLKVVETKCHNRAIFLTVPFFLQFFKQIFVYFLFRRAKEFKKQKKVMSDNCINKIDNVVKSILKTMELASEYGGDGNLFCQMKKKINF